MPDPKKESEEAVGYCADEPTPPTELPRAPANESESATAADPPSEIIPGMAPGPLSGHGVRTRPRSPPAETGSPLSVTPHQPSPTTTPADDGTAAGRARTTLPFTTDSWVYRELDFMRAVAYGLAVSLIIVGIGAGTDTKIGFLLTRQYVSAIIGILLFISFDGMLKHRMRHTFLADDALKLIIEGAVLPRTIRFTFILLLGLEVSAVFYFSGWGAYFVVWDYQKSYTYELLGMFCFCTAFHNLVFFNLIERRRRVSRWSWWWLDRTFFVSFFRMAMTVVFGDARETDLSGTVWITRFRPLEEKLQDYLSKQKSKTHPINKNVGLLFWWGVMTIVRILLHLAVQTCAYHLIVFNGALAALLLFGESRNFLDATVLHHPGWDWLIPICLFLGYAVTAFCELSREGAYDGRPIPMVNADWKESGAQIIGNISVLLSLAWLICHIDYDSLTWVVIASQLFVVTAMAVIYHFDTVSPPKNNAIVEAGSQSG